MNATLANPWLHRFAWLTATLTLLLPVTTGAVVTTLDAGMVFPDWPTSDGYSMVTYPWLSSARDQFVEHGHRLSGMVVGLFSISLAVWTWRVSSNRTARLLATAIFGSVFAQGLLGGARVLLDRNTMALIHGDFAAAVFSLMCVFVLVTGSQWESRSRVRDRATGQGVWLIAVLLFVAVATQYFLGGVLRHLELAWAWISHPWFALVPVMLAPMLAVAARRSGSPLLVRTANFMLLLIVSQALLGLATWYVKFGVPSWGVVAVRNSPSQIIVCSLHKVVGMLTLMTSVLNVVCANAVQLPRDQRDAAKTRSFESSIVGAAT